MAKLPEIAIKAWDEHEGPLVFTTVDKNGMPNTIYVVCVKRIDDDKIVVANNKMHKTLENIKAGTKASILYITKEKKAFQIKGTLDYHIDGDIYEDMKNRWLDKKYPGHGAVVLNIEEVYSGAEQLA
ncbi:MAG: pyridoxamine 5-phosphate oxidase [Desulfobacteraceae bacterium 4572_123]|nr:MAG: pyridoxamine 5-phosphate oxidase [Desulfobacteraceae bacterium 4572_123]